MNSQNLQQKKWYVIDSESKRVYSLEISIKFWTRSLELSLCDYSDAYVLVTGNITVVGADNNTKVAFKNFTPFRKCRTEINETLIDEVEHINIAMSIWINPLMIILILQGVHGSLKRQNRRRCWFNCWW